MLPTHIAIFEMFNLQLEPDDNSTVNKRQAGDESEAAVRHLLHEMPTVVGAEGSSHCAICVEGFSLSGVGKRIPCGHIFHENCISRWLSINRSCPLCRQKFPQPEKFFD